MLEYPEVSQQEMDELMSQVEPIAKRVKEGKRIWLSEHFRTLSVFITALVLSIDCLIVRRVVL